MTQADDSTEDALNPQIADEAETRGGLDPEAFQRELVIVTATVLILGVAGGSCLGMKIQRAEHQNNERAEKPQTEQAPSVTPERVTPGSEPDFSHE